MNNSIIKVSVILPSLNVVNYIDECVQSVINQSLKEIEIICVDAGSVDGTLEKLKYYAKKDSRIKVIISEKKSYGAQVNIGIEKAKGKYIGIVETDDYIKDNMYETLYACAEENQVDFVRSDFCRFYDENSKRIFKVVPLTYWRKEFEHFYNRVVNPEDDLNVFNLLKNNVTGIYRSDFFRKNNIKLNESLGASFQDNGLWFFTFIYAKKVYFLNSNFYLCRRDNPNSSVKNKEKVFVICDEYDYILKRLKLNDDIYNKFISAYWLAKYGSYYFTYTRVSEKFKMKFLLRFQKEFCNAYENKEIDESLFTKYQLLTLKKIIENPKEFYKNDNPKREDNSIIYYLRFEYLIKTLKYFNKYGFINTLKKIKEKF